MQSNPPTRPLRTVRTSSEEGLYWKSQKYSFAATSVVYYFVLIICFLQVLLTRCVMCSYVRAFLQQVSCKFSVSASLRDVTRSELSRNHGFVASVIKASD